MTPQIGLVFFRILCWFWITRSQIWKRSRRLKANRQESRWQVRVYAGEKPTIQEGAWLKTESPQNNEYLRFGSFIIWTECQIAFLRIIL